MFSSNMQKSFQPFHPLFILLATCTFSFTEASVVTPVAGNTEPNYTIVECGEELTPNYSIYFKDKNGFISPFHDILLYANRSENIFNMVVEIPRNTDTKFEISKANILNPIKPDVKNGQVRHVNSPYPHNYGAFPQTWENPFHKDERTLLNGDNDPIDVVEIGSRGAKTGDVLQVKVLGVFALIDDGETDWKVIAIDVNDPEASKLNDIEDVVRLQPTLLKTIKDWFKNYKLPVVQNTIGLNEEVKNREYAYEVINSVNQHWKIFIMNTSGSSDIFRDNLTVTESPFLTTLDKVQSQIPEECRK